MNHSASGEPETTNAERALWGMASLAGLVAATGDSQGIDLTPGADPRGAGHVLIDVLANLRHYADAAGLDFDAYDRQADEYYRSEIDATIQPVGLDVAAYRHYTGLFGDTTQALLHLARTAGIAVAYLDRDCIEDMRGAALTDDQWARVAPLLESYDEHVSWGDSNHLYLDQILVRAGIPDPDDTDDSGDAAA